MDAKARDTVLSSAIDSILAHIRDRRLVPGARLPSERELAGTLAISRHTVRQAYLSLAARGLMSIEHGRGVFLVAGDAAAEQSPLITDLADLKNLVNLLEVRQLIECGAIPLAMARATPADYARLRELIIAEEGRPFLHENALLPSVTFERELVNLAGNQALVNIETNVMTAWKNLWIRLELSEIKPYARTDEHHEILDAMEQGDVKLAQKSLHAHLSSILLVIERAAQRK